MARQQFQLGTTRGAMLPPRPIGSASADNAAAGQRQQDWNTAAAAQNQALRQAQLGGQTQADITKINNDTNRSALAQAFGYTDLKSAPNFNQLYAKFLTSPKTVQMGIYKAGGAPFLDDSEDSGLTGLQDVSEKLDKIHDFHIQTVADGLLTGKIGYDLVDNGQGGKTPSIYMMREIDNPDPQDRLLRPKIQIKEPASQVVKTYIERGVNSGQIPDLVSGKLPQSDALPTPKPTLNTDQFQQILNARANGQAPDAVDRFQQTLNARAGGVNQNQAVVANAVDDTSENTISPAAQVASSLSSPVATSVDPFVAAHNYLASPKFADDTSSAVSGFSNTFENVGSALGATAAAVANIPNRMSNAAMRLLGGQSGGQLGQLPLIQPEAQTPAVDPIIAAIRARQQQQDANDLILANGP